MEGVYAMESIDYDWLAGQKYNKILEQTDMVNDAQDDSKKFTTGPMANKIQLEEPESKQLKKRLTNESAGKHIEKDVKYFGEQQVKPIIFENVVQEENGGQIDEVKNLYKYLPRHRRGIKNEKEMALFSSYASSKINNSAYANNNRILQSGPKLISTDIETHEKVKICDEITITTIQ